MGENAAKEKQFLSPSKIIFGFSALQGNDHLGFSFMPVLVLTRAFWATERISPMELMRGQFLWLFTPSRNEKRLFKALKGTSNLSAVHPGVVCLPFGGFCNCSG